MAQSTPRTVNWQWLLIAGISIAGCGADATNKSALIPAGAEGKQIGVVNYQVTGQSAEGFTVVGLGQDGKEVTRVTTTTLAGGNLRYDFAYGGQRLVLETTALALGADGKASYSGTINGTPFTAAGTSEQDVKTTGTVPLDAMGIKAWASWGPFFTKMLPSAGLNTASCLGCVVNVAGAVVGIVGCIGSAGLGCGLGLLGAGLGLSSASMDGCFKSNNPCSLNPAH